jgi:predicted ATPase
LSAADYEEIAKTFHTIFLTGIPKMTLKEKDEARRFICLMDTLYDQRVSVNLDKLLALRKSSMH